MKGWKQIFLANEDQKKAGVAILISDKRDFEIKTVTLPASLEICMRVKKQQLESDMKQQTGST